MENEIANLIVEALSKIEKGVESTVSSSSKKEDDRDFLKPPGWEPPKALENLKLTEDPFTENELNELMQAVDDAIERETAANRGMEIGTKILKSVGKILPMFL